MLGFGAVMGEWGRVRQSGKNQAERSVGVGVWGWVVLCPGPGVTAQA